MPNPVRMTQLLCPPRRVTAAAPDDPFGDIVTEFSPLLVFDIGQGAYSDMEDSVPCVNNGVIARWHDQSGNDTHASASDLGSGELSYYSTTSPIGVRNNSTHFFNLATTITRAGTAFELWVVGYRSTETSFPIFGQSSFQYGGVYLYDSDYIRVEADETENVSPTAVTCDGRVLMRIRIPNNGSSGTYIGTGQAVTNIFAFNGATFTFEQVAGMSGNSWYLDPGNRLETLILLPAITDATGSTRVLELINQIMTARGADPVSF